MIQSPDHLQEPVITVARKDFTTLRQELTVREALESIRGRALGEKIVYFYVLDAERLINFVKNGGASLHKGDHRDARPPPQPGLGTLGG